jgi:hypothetical protein
MDVLATQPASIVSINHQATATPASVCSPPKNCHKPSRNCPKKILAKKSQVKKIFPRK